MLTITIGRNNDEITVRGTVSWMDGTDDDIVLEAVNKAARDLASVHGWIVDSKTALYEYRERIAQA